MRKPSVITLAFAAFASGISGCALFQPEKPTLRMAYEAPANDSTGLMRVFSMNGNTVLQFFDVAAANPTIYVDGATSPATYQVVGQQLAIVSGQHQEIRVTTEHGAVVVHSIPSPALSPSSAASPASSPPPAARTSQVVTPAVHHSPEASPDLAAARAELAEVQRELSAIRESLRDQGSHEATSSMAQVSAKLDDLESRIDRAAQAIWRFSFETGSAAFSPSPGAAAALLKDATAAQAINVRGRTDSENADAANIRIAAARAQAARDFLVTHGVASQKIRVYSLGSGAFIADNSTEAGRRANRRVEIEIVKGS